MHDDVALAVGGAAPVPAAVTLCQLEYGHFQAVPLGSSGGCTS